MGVQKMRHGDAVEHGSIALKQLVHAPIPFGFKIHAEMAAEFAAVQHDRIADRLTFVVVCFQRRVNIVRPNTINGAVKS
jgi:hypothetical protein